MEARDPIADGRLLPTLIAGYGVGLVAVLLSEGRSPGQALYQGFLAHFPSAAATIGGGALMFYLLRVVAVVRPASPFSHIAWEIRSLVREPGQIYSGVRLLCLLAIFTGSFSAWKVFIPGLHPFSWDERLHQFDLLLHGGVEPWRYLHRSLHTPMTTAAINLIYHLWFFVMHFTYVWVAFDRRRPELQGQFLLAFYASWILMGTALAIALSSAGPCYYANVVGEPSPYAPLLAQLRASDEIWPVWALDVQAMLWEGYRSGGGRITSAISAMPSMHVATTALTAILLWRYWGASVGLVAVAFLLSILLGSVHLGWHYAVDGYVALGLALAVWWGAGYVVRQRCERFSRAPSSTRGAAMNGGSRGDEVL